MREKKVVKKASRKKLDDYSIASITMPVDLAVRMEAAATLSGINVSAYLREAVEFYLGVDHTRIKRYRLGDFQLFVNMSRAKH